MSIFRLQFGVCQFIVIKKFLFTCLFFLEMPKMPNVIFRKCLYGTKKWEYARRDDIDLMCEISIFSSCSWPGLCPPCRKHLTWCLEILQRWNYIDFIDFYSVLEVTRKNRRLFNKSLKFEYRRKRWINKLISKK